MASKLDRIRAGAKRQRDAAKARKGSFVRKGSMLATGYGIGKLEESGRMDDIPQPFGVPRTVVVAGVAMVASAFLGGTAGDITEGIGDGAGTVAAYQFGAGMEVSGGERTRDPELNRLQDELEDVERLQQAVPVVGEEDAERIADAIEAEVVV